MRQAMRNDGRLVLDPMYLRKTSRVFMTDGSEAV